jgi:hypothetical protein
VLRQQTHRALSNLLNEIDITRRAIDPDQEPSLMMGPADVFGDLQSLEDEFVVVHCDLRQERLSVTTESIELEGVTLGPFEIRIDWSQKLLGYEVIARDPQPAARAPDVTHPHVECRQLCEGAGRLAIQSALCQGRLADFFIVVRQILETYNPHSAHVALDAWFGRDCPDCGGTLDDEDGSRCEECSTDFCGACVESCRVCDALNCDHCQEHCPECEAPVCPGCLTTCVRCNHNLCERCQNARSCSNCRPQESENISTTAASGAAVHSLRVGQTPVSA